MSYIRSIKDSYLYIYMSYSGLNIHLPIAIRDVGIYLKNDDPDSLANAKALLESVTDYLNSNGYIVDTKNKRNNRIRKYRKKS